MGLPDLYPAQVGSPYTTLAAPYTSGESTMTLVDVTKLPDAPNIVCLAGDVAGEFRYTGKDGNILQGVAALPGTPAATTWPAGTFAFRGVSAYDHNALIEYAQMDRPKRGAYDAIVYKSGTSVIAEDATGATIASGTAGTDDVTVIQAAVDVTRNGGVVLFDGSEYTIDATINITTSLALRGNGSTFNSLLSTEQTPIIYATGTPHGNRVLSVDAAKGDRTIYVTDVSDIRENQLILVYDYSDWPGYFATNIPGELHRVRSISEADDDGIYTITLYESLYRSYLVEKTARARPISPIQVEISDFKFIGPGEDTDAQGIHLYYTDNSSIKNCKYSKIGSHANSIRYSFGTNISECNISNSNRSGLGYGIALGNGCAHVHIDNNTFRRCRHAVSQGGARAPGQCRDTFITNNVFYDGTATSIDGHPPLHSNYVIGNTIYRTDGGCAINPGATHVVVQNNVIVNGSIGLRAPVNCESLSITGNYIYGTNANGHSGILYLSSGSGSIGRSIKRLSVLNNTCVGTYTGIAAVGTYLYLEQAVISGNVISGQTGDWQPISVLPTANLMKQCVISNNTIDGAIRDAIYIENAPNARIVNNEIRNPGNHPTNNSFCGIRLGGDCSNSIISRNVIYKDGDADKGPRHYIIDGSRSATPGESNNLRIEYNQFAGARDSPINLKGENHIVRFNTGYVTENSGSAPTVADGGTIAHGCAVAPTKVTLTGSVAGEMVTITSIDDTNITVAIKKPDGSAGTTQTIYWRAEV